MTTFTNRRGIQGIVALLLLTLLMPLAAPMANAQIFRRKQDNPQQPKQGMSMGKKVVLLSGAALLYFLWKKHQSNAAKQVQNGQVAGNGRQPQLYRSRNGGIYYRDAQGNPVWLTVPQQGVEVPSTDLQRYAPDYRRYRGPAPAAPSGYRSQPFNEFDNSVPGPTRAGAM